MPYQSFQLAQTDRNIRLCVLAPHRFQVFEGLAQPELFTQISIDCFAGRSLTAKRRLYQSLVENLIKFGIPDDHILILLRESPLQNWGFVAVRQHVILIWVFNWMYKVVERKVE